MLEERLRITQEIAAENVEHLRLSQIASGMMVLDMKDEQDGVSDRARDLKRQENFNALERCMNRINDLEASLKSVDKALSAASEGLEQ